MKFLEGRATNSMLLLSKAIKTVEISDQTFLSISDETIYYQHNHLEIILKKMETVLALVTPFTAIATIFGMNVPVPFGDEDSHWPFGVVLIIALCLTLLTFGGMRRFLR